LLVRRDINTSDEVPAGKDSRVWNATLYAGVNELKKTEPWLLTHFAGFSETNSKKEWQKFLVQILLKNNCLQSDEVEIFWANLSGK